MTLSPLILATACLRGHCELRCEPCRNGCNEIVATGESPEVTGERASDLESSTQIRQKFTLSMYTVPV